MSLPWRKRFDNRVLRWQARFEGIAFDRTAPWLMSAGLWAVLALLALARSRELSEETALAQVMQTVWLIGEGFKPDASLLGGNYLAEQAGFLIYPVALLAKIFPDAITLLIIQSGALALGIVPLWRLARNVAHLRVGSTVAIAITYGIYSAIHTLNLSGFRLEVFALPALIAAVHAGYRERWFRYALWVGIVLAARADLGFAVAGLGVLWFLEGRRRLGWITFGVGFGYTLLALLVIQPAFSGGQYPHVDDFSAYGGDDPFSALWGIVTSPVLFLRELFSETNFARLVSLLAPVLFLPVVAPRYLLPAVPLYTLYLVADVPEDDLLEAGQAVPITAFIFVALVFALARTGRVIVQKVNVDRRVIGALIFTSAVFFAADSVTSPYEDPWAWGRRDVVDAARLDAAELIPEDAVVRATPKVLPLLTERVGLLEFDPPEDNTTVHREAVERVNWLVFDRAEAPTWTALEALSFCQGVLGLGWIQVFNAEQVHVYTTQAEAARVGLDPVVLLDEDNEPVGPCVFTELVPVDT